MTTQPPSSDRGRELDSESPDRTKAVISTHGLKKYYYPQETILHSLLKREDKYVHAVDGVSLTINENEILGLVGESGCGKSTLARTLARLEEPTDGRIFFQGTDITDKSERALRQLRSDIQFIHQDPSSSLNPRKRIGQLLSRPLKLHTDLDSDERYEKIAELLTMVGLSSGQRDRYPRELSGGQRQRVEIARALSVSPSLIVADEPTSALDVTVQAQVLELLKDLQQEYNLSILFISHDLRIVRHIADRVGVMYLGQVVETGPTEAIFSAPRHPYTQSLLSSIPSVSGKRRDRITIEGELPDPVNPPSGCRFHTRCPLATEECVSREPDLRTESTGHEYMCHYSDADISEQ